MSDKVSIKEYLDKNGELTYSCTGVSMLPLLREGRDLFTVRKKGEERCRAGDVVLYSKNPGKLILHRIIKVRPDDYVILGDNCITKEYGITDSDIIAVMTGFVRSGRVHRADEPLYRLYTFLMIHTAGIRIVFRRIFGGIRKRIKKNTKTKKQA